MYRDFHYKDENVMKQSSLYNGHSYSGKTAGKTASLYWADHHGFSHAMYIFRDVLFKQH